MGVLRWGLLGAFVPLGLFFASQVKATPTDSKEAWRKEAISAGSAVLEKHQCVRCHPLSEEKEFSRDVSCRLCHEWIQSTKDDPDKIKEMKKTYPKWERYIQNAVLYLSVPNLSMEGARVRPDFMESYLAAPFDLRPVLNESMIRNKLTPEEIRILVRYFAARGGAPDPYANGMTKASAPTTPPKKAELVTKGEELFAQKGCPSCHLFGNKDFGAQVDAAFLEDMRPFSALAPDLRLTKQKVRPEILVSWIANPKAIDPETPMPELGVSKEEAEAIAQFLWYGDPGPWASPAEPAPPKRKRKVTYAILEKEIFKKICEHCHMDPGRADNGAGNGGGFGYAGRGLSLESFQSMSKGSKQDDGTYASILRPGKSGKPILIERLERRAEENLRDRVLPFAQLTDQSSVAYPSEAPGMPLGLPALSKEQMQMIYDWVEAGAPGPDGKPSIKK